MADVTSDTEFVPRFGTATTLTMDEFHQINAATLESGIVSNPDLLAMSRMILASTETRAGVVYGLIRRILSDDAVICGLQDENAALRVEVEALKQAGGGAS